jgi:ADP-heptose:LPS heptosyltransferase
MAALVVPRGRKPELVRKIGIMANPALGDTLLTSGPIQDLRAAYPKAELVFFAAHANVGAAKLLPCIDRLELISFTNPLQAIRIVRAAQLDLMFDFTSWQRVTAFVTLWSGARCTFGFDTPGQHRAAAYAYCTEHRRDRHEFENQRALVAAAGLTPSAPARVVIPAGELPDVVAAGRDTIVFHAWPAGSGTSTREWPRAHWVELAKRLRAPGRRFVVTGSAADLPRSSELCESLLSAGVPAEVFTGSNGLFGVAQLLRHARLLVSVNTGIMHLGWILGTPTVAINGPTSHLRWGPLGAHTLGVDTPDGTGGFLHLGFEFDNMPHDVMQKITGEAVGEAAQRLLARDRDRKGLQHTSTIWSQPAIHGI